MNPTHLMQMRFEGWGIQTPITTRDKGESKPHHQEGGTQNPPSSRQGRDPHPTTKKEEGFAPHHHQEAEGIHTPPPSRRRRDGHPTTSKKEEKFTPHLLQEGGGIHTPHLPPPYWRRWGVKPSSLLMVAGVRIPLPSWWWGVNPSSFLAMVGCESLLLLDGRGVNPSCFLIVVGCGQFPGLLL